MPLQPRQAWPSRAAVVSVSLSTSPCSLSAAVPKDRGVLSGLERGPRRTSASAAAPVLPAGSVLSSRVCFRSVDQLTVMVILLLSRSVRAEPERTHFTW